jgi:hypothetical protein
VTNWGLLEVPLRNERAVQRRIGTKKNYKKCFPPEKVPFSKFITKTISMIRCPLWEPLSKEEIGRGEITLKPSYLRRERTIPAR